MKVAGGTAFHKSPERTVLKSAKDFLIKKETHTVPCSFGPNTYGRIEFDRDHVRMINFF